MFYLTAFVLINLGVISIANILEIINAVASLALTYTFLLSGFNALSNVDYTKYGIGLSGTYLRMISLFVAVAVNIGHAYH